MENVKHALPTDFIFVFSLEDLSSVRFSTCNSLGFVLHFFHCCDEMDFIGGTEGAFGIQLVFPVAI